MGHAAECHISSVIANTSHADFVFKPDRAIVLDPAELPSMRNVRLRQYPIQMQSYWHLRFIAFRRLPQMESVLIEPPSNLRRSRPAPAPDRATWTTLGAGIRRAAASHDR